MSLYKKGIAGLNEHTFRETMVFDSPTDPASYFFNIGTIKNHLLELPILKVKWFDKDSVLLQFMIIHVSCQTSFPF